jgi:hypothetical protein
MPEAADIFGTVLKNGSVILLARIVGADGANIIKADINTVKYSIYLLDKQNPDSRTAVAGHVFKTLAVAEVIFDTLQTNLNWTVDSKGYNFRHELDVSTYPAFAITGRRYLIEYQLTPAVGQIILIRFRLNVI